MKAELRFMQRYEFVRLICVIAVVAMMCGLSACYYIAGHLSGDPDKDESMLSEAIYAQGNYQAVVELIREGVDINSFSDPKLTQQDAFSDHDNIPLAQTMGGLPRRYDIVELLAKSGAEVNRSVDNNGLTYMAFAASDYDQRLCDILLEAGADINLSEGFYTPLDYMLRYGNNSSEEMFDYLISNGAKVTNTSLQATLGDEENCAGYGNAKRLLEYLKKQNIEYTIDPILEAAILGDNNAILKYIQSGEITGDSDKNILFFSAAFSNLTTLKALIDSGYNIHDTDKDHNTLLHIAAMYNTPDVVEYFIKKGIGDDDEVGQTPLISAIQTGNLKAADILLENGARWNTMIDDNVYGEDALFSALEYGPPESITYVMNHGYPKEENIYEAVMTNWFASAVVSSYNCNKTERLKILFNENAPVDWNNCIGRDEDITLFLYDNGVDPTNEDWQLACLERQHKVIKRLIESGLDVNYKGISLEMAICSGDLETIKLLVENGADVNRICEDNAYDYEGATPLIIAAQNLSGDIVKYLIEAGADKNAKDKEGKTAYDWAKTRYFFEDNQTVLDILKL
jgi:ankyrin repeat protein